MKLPEVKDGERYVDLYVVDFGESTSVGFTAEEVGELLESEKFGGVKVYKIHNAYPDGRMELKGVVNETFELEMGMFFYAANQEREVKLTRGSCGKGYQYGIVKSLAGASSVGEGKT